MSGPLLPSAPLPSIVPSIRVFSNELAVCVRWPKYWGFSFNIRPSDEYSCLISYKIDWFDLFAVRGILKESSLAAQFEGINSSVLCLLHGPALTTKRDHWEGHSLDYMYHCQQSNVCFFNTLSRFVRAFLSRSNSLLIPWLQSPSTVILEPKKRKSVITSTFTPSTCHEVMRLDATTLVYLIFSLRMALSLSSFTLIKRLFSSSSLSVIRVISPIYMYICMCVYICKILFNHKGNEIRTFPTASTATYSRFGEMWKTRVLIFFC